MGAFGETLASMGVFSAGYLKMLLKDVRPADFGRKPNFAGKVIDTNHPAFVWGHLGLYPTRVISLTGGDGKAIEALAGWNDLFKAGAECRDDAAGTIYPAMDALVAQFNRAHDAAVAHVRTVPDEVLAQPNPNEQSRDRFPTVGALCGFLLSGHVMVHAGQISAWRRCMGLASAMG